MFRRLGQLIRLAWKSGDDVGPKAESWNLLDRPFRELREGLREVGPPHGRQHLVGTMLQRQVQEAAQLAARLSH